MDVRQFSGIDALHGGIVEFPVIPGWPHNDKNINSNLLRIINFRFLCFSPALTDLPIVRANDSFKYYCIIRWNWNMEMQWAAEHQKLCDGTVSKTSTQKHLGIGSNEINVEHFSFAFQRFICWNKGKPCSIWLWSFVTKMTVFNKPLFLSSSSTPDNNNNNNNEYNNISI